jgi:hypothetical protein
VTPNSDWWDRAKLPPGPPLTEIRKRELLCTLRKDRDRVTALDRLASDVRAEA